MNTNKTGSKKSLTIKPQTAQSLKRYKSQEVYLVSKKSNVVATLPTVQVNLNAPPNRLSEKKENKPTTLDSIKQSQKMRIANSSKSKTRAEKPLFAKMLNDESIQELDTEENKIDDSEQLDEELCDIKCTNDQLYNSIGECSPVKDRKLINNLPQPFVKQGSKAITIEEKQDTIEFKQRKMLQAAKKGDRDAFLEIVEM
jgi:hypothetical protein